MVTLSTASMSYINKERTLVGEASTLGFAGLEKLYPDSTDLGIWVVSHKTGIRKPFRFDKRIMSQDLSDILGWVFYNDHDHLILRIYND